MSNTPPPPPPPSAPPPPPPAGGFGAMPGQPVSPAGDPLADAGIRVLARFLDGVILAIIGAILAGIVGGSNAMTGTGDVDGAWFGAVVLSIAIGFVWDPVFTKLKGGTPMKLAFGMRVVRADNGGPVEWSHAIIRWLIPVVFTIVPFLGALAALIVVIISLVFIFTKPMRQAVWDLVAKTLVVKSR